MSDSATPCTVVYQAFLSFTASRSLLRLMSFESVMPSNHLTLWDKFFDTSQYRDNYGINCNSQGLGFVLTFNNQYLAILAFHLNLKAFFKKIFFSICVNSIRSVFKLVLNFIFLKSWWYFFSIVVSVFLSVFLIFSVGSYI